MSEPLEPAQLRARDLARVAVSEIRSRRLRSALSVLGVALGVAAIVAVLGLSASSQAGLLAQIDRLGTNLLTVTNGQTLTGDTAELPSTAPSMIARVDGVTAVEGTTVLDGLNAYRTRLIPSVQTNALSVQATDLGLARVIGTRVDVGRDLDAAAAREPVAVLGAAAAERLGIDRIWPGERIWIGPSTRSGQWFDVVGILDSAPLTPTIDSAILVGYPAAEQYLHADAHPETIYVRADIADVTEVRDLLPATADPADPSQADVSRPSDALVARADSAAALGSLFLALSAVSLAVGAVGVANVMVIGVRERRSEIGLRRALGATRGHIRLQFLTESVLLGAAGGVAGVLIGSAATLAFASTAGWDPVLPPIAWGGGLAAAIVIGAAAGLLPAIGAARADPTVALRQSP